jgi:hypothetical protein
MMSYPDERIRLIAAEKNRFLGALARLLRLCDS